MTTTREAVAKVFGLKDPTTIDALTAEAQIKMARGTARLIIHDFIGRIQIAWKTGPVLPVITQDNEVHWNDLPRLRHIRQQASVRDDRPMVEAIDSAISLVEELDPTKHVAFARLTPDQFRVYKLPTDEPERQLDEILSTWSC